MTRILITGGTGFIGQHLVHHLVESKQEIALLVREEYAGGKPLPPSLANIRDRFDLVFADLRNFNLTVRAVREAQPDFIFHLAAAGASDPFLPPDTAIRHNVTGTLNLMRAAFEKNTSTRRMVIARTPGECTTMNSYATSKLAAWNFAQMYVRTQQWPIFGAMIFQCYGSGQAGNTLVPTAARAARAHQYFPMTAGTQKRDWIHVSDVAAGLAAFIDREKLTPGDTIDLGSGQATAVVDVVRIVFKLARSGGRPLVGKLPSRPGESPTQVADVQVTEAKLGWRAKLSLEEGLRRYLSHLSSK
ncbi:MAG: NAD(P)-dependent oxidoreductase [Ardenticatenaceae bacterium]|nr:NAD(P)-dependent oxidoreductase [Ardenticatenaceae bacterium]